jgi:2,3-bisphosphoglycerate-independent phosphoglycerate mutase
VGLLEAAQRAGVPRVWVHHVLDGRDTPPQSAREFAARAQAAVDRRSAARVATVSGRYWTMDRDKRWDRTERAYRMLTGLEGHRALNAATAIEAAYARGETDEFVAPTVMEGAEPIREGDAILVYNFRPDRVRQIVRALADPSFQEFSTHRLAPRLVTLTLYDRTFDDLGVHVAFPPEHPRRTLGELYAEAGLRQLRIAETEKYAHVTYFFSGGREAPFQGEDRLLIPSPKVATYDQEPAMSAQAVTQALLQRLEARYDLVVLNFANPDMVGHTGRFEPTREAVRVVDACIGRLVEAALVHDYLVAITADHGNAESMVDEQGRPRTAHTTAPVPFILVHPSLRGLRLREGGGLSSVAPTLLALVGLPVPPEMTAKPLVAPRPVAR